MKVKLNCSYCDHEQKENICVDKTRPESLISTGMISIYFQGLSTLIGGGEK